MNVQVINKSKHPLPAYATELSAGMDIRANLSEPITLEPLQRCLVPTGLYIALPKGFEAQVRPRSGLAIKKGITVLNSPGTIDADYRGEVCIIMENTENFLTKVMKNFKEDFERLIQPGEYMIGPFSYLVEKLVDIFNNPIKINTRDRIAQGVICPVFQAEFIEEELTDTERGSGGFGSTKGC